MALTITMTPPCPLHLVFLLFVMSTVVFMVLYVLQLNNATVMKHALHQDTLLSLAPEQLKTFTGRYQPAAGMSKVATLSGFTAQNPFDQIDRIYFINMDHRKDRYHNIFQELARMGVPSSKIQRIPGVKDRFGALGCSKAHINALLDCQAHKYRNCLVLEDDFMFKYNRELTWEQLNRFFALNIQWDVAMLASFTRAWEHTNFDFLVRVREGQTTGGYMVNQPFLGTLLANFQEGVRQLETVPENQRGTVCIDQHWKTLQPTSHWYTFHPVMGHQRDSVSDIEGRFTEYPDKHELFTEPPPPFEFLVCVQNCRARFGKNPARTADLQTLCRTQPTIACYQYLGDPDLPTDFAINERDHVITLRCQDDYLNLCHKFGQLVHALRNITGLNHRFRALKGVFCTDDDVVLTVPKMYSFFQKHQTEAYWGHVTQHELLTSHLKNKALESPAIRQQLEKLPGLLKYDVEVSPCEYCCGGGFFLRMDTLLLVSDSDDLFAPFPRTQDELDKFLVTTAEGRQFYSKAVCVIEDLNVGAAVSRLGLKPTDVDIHQIANW